MVARVGCQQHHLAVSIHQNEMAVLEFQLFEIQDMHRTQSVINPTSKDAQSDDLLVWDLRVVGLHEVYGFCKVSAILIFLLMYL
jgi:hypothetical protein